MGTSSTTRADTDGRFGHRLSGLAVAIGLVLLMGGFVWAAALYRPYTVPSNSMAPAVEPGDRILAERTDGADVRRGDVVVFADSVWSDLPMVKRVIGVGGDTVVCCDTRGLLTINGKPVLEPYLADGEQPSPSEFRTTVPDGNLFLLGDNRSQSQDSRVRLADRESGSVPRASVEGRMDATAWPSSRAGMLDPVSGASAAGPLPWCVAGVLAGALLILGGAAHGPIAGLRRGART